MSPSKMQKKWVATAAGWDMVWVPAERGGLCYWPVANKTRSLCSGRSFRTVPVTCETIFYTIEQPVLFTATQQPLFSRRK